MARNPRRAYRADGSEIPPLTVGAHIEAGYQRAMIYCAECHHHASIDVSALPPETPIPDISLRARCKACGSRNCTSSPDMLEFYEVNERRKRERT